MQAQENTSVHQGWPEELNLQFWLQRLHGECLRSQRGGQGSQSGSTQKADNAFKSGHFEKDLLRKMGCRSLGRITGASGIVPQVGIAAVELSPPAPQRDGRRVVQSKPLGELPSAEGWASPR